MPSLPRRRRWLWIAITCVGLLGVAGAVLVRVAGHSDPVTLQDVLRRFRAEAPDARTGTSAPAAGVYSYRVSGTERGGAGPIQISRTLPSLATMTLSRSGAGWETQTDYSRQHIEGARFVVQGDAIAMTWRRVDVSFGFGRDDRRDLRGRYRIAPLSPRPGQLFRDVYSAGTLKNTVTTRVLREEPVVVGGTPVPTLVITSSTVTEGALSGTRDETLWWSPDLRVAIRSRVRVVVTGVFGFRSTIDMTLQGLRPAT